MSWSSESKSRFVGFCVGANDVVLFDGWGASLSSASVGVFDDDFDSDFISVVDLSGGGGVFCVADFLGLSDVIFAEDFFSGTGGAVFFFGDGGVDVFGAST